MPQLSAMAQESNASLPPWSLRSVFLGLRRHTSSGLYIPELDGLRFTAIFCVYLYHLSSDVVRHNPAGAATPSTPFFLLTQSLNIGVPLFFVISGMILGLPFARYWLLTGPKISLKRYFLRRVTRLEPPYIGALLLLFALKYLGHRGTIAEMLPHLGASAAYLHTFLYRDMSTINPVAWSLEVEVQFYILAPILALFFAVRLTWLRRMGIGALICAAAISMPWVDMGPEARADSFVWMTHLSLAGNIQYFLTGFLLADFYLLIPAEQHAHRRWDVVTMLGWPLIAVMLVLAPSAAYKALPAIILLLFIPAFYGIRTRRLFANLFVASIGGMCYTIYLLHNYAIAALGFITERVGLSLPFEARLLIQMLLMSPVVLGISILYFKLVEQPCMRSDWPMRFNLSIRRLLVEVSLRSGRIPAHPTKD